MTVSILHLFPRELGASGDSGNVVALDFRLRERGIPTSVSSWGPGSAIPPRPDVVVVGSGPWSAMERLVPVVHDMGKTLREWSDAGTVFFAVGGGAELLGSEIISPTGEVIEGAGLAGLTSRRDSRRLVGYMRIESPVGELVGFADLSSAWELSVDSQPLGHSLIGPRSVAAVDGLWSENVVATQLGGPALPLNPSLADALIGRVLARKKMNASLEPLPVDHDAEMARQVILDNFGQVFTTIAL